MPDPKKPHQNWSRLERDKAAQEITRMCERFELEQSWRHQMAFRGACAYGGIGVGDLFGSLAPYDAPWGSNQNRARRAKGELWGGWGSRVSEQHARSTADTLHQKICGLDEPKTQMVATDAEWELRRKGVWADRFIEGNYHLPQGSFHDVWAMGRHAFLMSACATGTVAIRCEPDYVGKKVHCQLRSTLQTFIDPADSAAGRPLSYFDITWENPEYLVEDERYKGFKDEIWSAAEVPPQHEGVTAEPTFGTPMVKMYSAWRMPFGSFKGRSARVIGKKCVIWEDWDNPEPPLAFFRMQRCLGDQFWAENFIEIMLRPLQDAEDIDDIAQQTMRRTSSTYVVGDDSMQGALLNAKDVNVLRWDPKMGGKSPDILKPEILSQQYFDYRDRKLAIARELSGVSLLHSSGERQGGVQSGRAIRLEASLLPERFAVVQRDWRHFLAVDLAKIYVRSAREIGQREPDWQVTWPGADFDGKVKVEALDIDDSIYELRPYAVGERKNTPADRAEMAQEMYDRGEITADQLSIINNGLLDTHKETLEVSSQRRYVAKVADDILHAEEDEIVDESAYMTSRYIPPDPWLDPAAALAQLLPVYRQAIIDGVPQNRRNLLRRFAEDIWALKLQKDRDAAMANASVNVAATPQQAFPTAQSGVPGVPAPATGTAPAAAPTDLGGGLGGGAPAAPINAPGMGLA